MNSASLAAILTATVVVVACAGTPVGGEPRYGVCRADINDFVTSTLRQTVTRIEIRSYAEHSPPLGLLDSGSALAFVEECPGFHAFEIRGTWSLCEHIPHYGKGRASYVRYEGAYDGCQHS